MLKLPFGLIAFLAAGTGILGSLPAAWPEEIVSEQEECRQETAALIQAVTENPEKPIVRSRLFIGSSGATENSPLAVLRPDDDAKIQVHLNHVLSRAWPGKASTGGSNQRGAASPPWLLQAALEACRRVLDYYARNVRLMNLDAVLGVRVAEGQFYLSLQDLAAEGGAEQENAGSGRATSVELRSLLLAAAVVGDAAETHVKGKNQAHPGLLSLVHRCFFAGRLAGARLPVSAHTSELVLLLQDPEKMTEQQSDACLDELFSASGCVISTHCWELMTARNYSKYSLTHQVLYFITGLQAECGAQLSHMAAGEDVMSGVGDILAHMLAHLCSAVLAEAKEISKAGFPELLRDLFMEQGVLCGMLGYHDFFREEWVRLVLSWQRREGCFGDINLFYSDTRSDHQEEPTHKRVRREETLMTDGCLAHRSAVALGYISVFIRLAASNTSDVTPRFL